MYSRDNVEQINITENPKAGREYYIWDKVIGPVDCGLVKIEEIHEGKAKVFDLFANTEYTLDTQGLVWELNPYDDVFAQGVDWLDTL